MVSLRKPHVDRIAYFSDDHNRKLADWEYAGGKRVELNARTNASGPLIVIPDTRYGYSDLRFDDSIPLSPLPF